MKFDTKNILNKIKNELNERKYMLYGGDDVVRLTDAIDVINNNFHDFILKPTFDLSEFLNEDWILSKDKLPEEDVYDVGLPIVSCCKSECVQVILYDYRTKNFKTGVDCTLNGEFTHECKFKDMKVIAWKPFDDSLILTDLKNIKCVNIVKEKHH